MNSDSKIKTILIAGGSGLIGRHLVETLGGSAHIRVLSRSGKKVRDAEVFLWDPAVMQIDMESVRGADIIINLCGEGVADKSWSASRKQELLLSRTQPVQCLAQALARSGHRPELILQASAIGLYGSHPGVMIGESSTLEGKDYLSMLTKQWEEAAEALRPLCRRLVILRTGLVLSGRGGIWPKMTMTAGFRLLNWFGDGRQRYSWIHIDDVGGAVSHLISHDSVDGPVNITAPGCVPQRELVGLIGKRMGGPVIRFGIPSLVLRLLLGKRADMVLADQWVVPEKLLRSGYRFQFAEAEAAVNDLMTVDHA